jgi:hypothetical protein
MYQAAGGTSDDALSALKQLDKTNDQDACEALGEGLKVLTTRLTEPQAGSAIRLFLKRIKQLHFAWALQALAGVLARKSGDEIVQGLNG